MNRADLVAFARETLDTPFLHQGRVAGRGIDCAGVVVHVATRAGLPCSDSTNYGRRPYNGQLESALDAQPCLQRVTRAPLPGDVLLMRFGPSAQHLGIYTGTRLIHAYQTAGRCVEHSLDAAWQRRIVRVYGFLGVDE